MSDLATYIPGNSWLHRAPVGLKVAALAVGVIALLYLRTLVALGLGTGVILMLYVAAHVPARRALAQLRPLLWIALAVGGFQVAVAGWQRAVVVVGQLVLAVTLASLVTFTTRVSDMLDSLEHGLGPLRRVGVDPARVALVLALTVRAVPVMVRLAGEVRDAQRARGLTASPRAFAVPMLVRALRHADALGEAMAARGLDD